MWLLSADYRWYQYTILREKNVAFIIVLVRHNMLIIVKDSVLSTEDNIWRRYAQLSHCLVKTKSMLLQKYNYFFYSTITAICPANTVYCNGVKMLLTVIKSFPLWIHKLHSTPKLQWCTYFWFIILVSKCIK